MTVNLFGGRAGTRRAGEPHHAAWVGPDSRKWSIGLWEGFLLVINILDGSWVSVPPLNQII